VDGHFGVGVHQIENDDLSGGAADDESARLGTEGDLLDGQTRVVAERVEVADFSERRPLVLAVLVVFCRKFL